MTSNNTYNESCRYIATAVTNLLFGTLIVKFGPRKLIAAGFLALCISPVLCATATHILQFYLEDYMARQGIMP